MDEFREARMAWERQYEKGAFLRESIQSEMSRIAEMFQTHDVRRVLDLGCGCGRHTLYLAQQGFEVVGLDIAPSGLRATKTKVDSEELSGYYTLADIIRLPFADAVFDAVISVRVIHHNRLALIQQTVDEIWRVLQLEGLVWITVPVPKGHGSKGGREIEPGTWVPHHGIEAGLPHHLFTEGELRELFQRYDIVSLHIFKTSHYSLLAQKPET
ncbi:MAG: class I SAM-dependent methyltransferase [Candidatus Hermodarchaeota archaeon]|nr:class I SAM-dependent methyltransferase [Candidatus Hermodarchaeota archaeon]